MKSYTDLYPQIIELGNLYTAADKTRKRKSRKLYVEDFELHRERLIRKLHNELRSESYSPSGYRQFYIHDPKKRLISAAPYRDRIVHHALCNVISPLIEKRFIYDSYSCRVGKGTGAARERCRQYTNRFRYVLKCDVKKFFQSIDHEILFHKLTQVIRCKPTLELCRKIIDSSCDKEESPGYFPGDDLFAPHGRKKGIPIGNLTSQLWANFYLDRLDHFIKEELRAPGYVRYTDDFLLWPGDKQFLRDCKAAVSEFLASERLQLQERKTRILPTRVGVPCLGFRFFPGLRPRIIGEGKRRFEKRARRLMDDYSAGRLSQEDLCCSVFSWTQYAAYGNTKGLIDNYYKKGFGQTGF